MTDFNPLIHLAYEAPKHIHTMEEIGLQADQGVSPTAISKPFHLFSEEAINTMRSEVLSPTIQDNFSYTSDIAPRQTRGYVSKDGPHGQFIKAAWKHPKTLDIISGIAGVDLVTQIDYEIGHVNMSVPGNKVSTSEEGVVVGWHRDSYSFVCVLMLSDTSGMIGGETALRTGFGTIMKVGGLSKGSALVLQGRYIEHQALQAFGGQERITMVTSFRPKSPFVKDATVLKTVRPISNLAALYGQTVEYQLENSLMRVEAMLNKVRQNMATGNVDVAAIKAALDFEIRQFSHLNEEIVPVNEVRQGMIAEIYEKTTQASHFDL